MRNKLLFFLLLTWVYPLQIFASNADSSILWQTQSGNVMKIKSEIVSQQYDIAKFLNDTYGQNIPCNDNLCLNTCPSNTTLRPNSSKPRCLSAAALSGLLIKSSNGSPAINSSALFHAYKVWTRRWKWPEVQTLRYGFKSKVMRYGSVRGGHGYTYYQVIIMQTAIPHPTVEYSQGRSGATRWPSYTVNTDDELQNKNSKAKITVPLKPSFSARYMKEGEYALSSTRWQDTRNFQHVPLTPGRIRGQNFKLIDQLNTVICVPTPRCDRSKLKEGWKHVTYVACAKFAQKYTTPLAAKNFTSATTFTNFLKRFVMMRQGHWCPGTLVHDK